jgi:hypothetical protein
METPIHPLKMRSLLWICTRQSVKIGKHTSNRSSMNRASTIQCLLQDSRSSDPWDSNTLVRIHSSSFLRRLSLLLLPNRLLYSSNKIYNSNRILQTIGSGVVVQNLHPGPAVHLLIRKNTSRKMWTRHHHPPRLNLNQHGLFFIAAPVLR